MKNFLLVGYAVALFTGLLGAQTFEPNARLYSSTSILSLTHRYLTPSNPPMATLDVEVMVWFGPTATRPPLPRHPQLIGDSVPLELFDPSWQYVPLLQPPTGTICAGVNYCGSAGNLPSVYGGLSFQWIPMTFRGPRITLADVLVPPGFNQTQYNVYFLYYFRDYRGAWYHGHLVDIS